MVGEEHHLLILFYSPPTWSSRTWGFDQKKYSHLAVALQVWHRIADTILQSCLTVKMAPTKPPYDPIVSVEGMYKGSVSGKTLLAHDR